MFMRREGSEEWCSWGGRGLEEWCSWGGRGWRSGVHEEGGSEEWCS